MAKIIFFQELWAEYNGPMYLSAFLKEHGHQFDMFIGKTAHDFYEAVEKGKPDLIGFSCMSGMHPWALAVAKELKEKYGVKTIFGGPHPTFFPQMIDNPAVDIVCQGEGEYPLLDLMNAIDAKGSITQIQNLWVKEDGKVFRNQMRDLVNDLDTFPTADRTIYYKYPFLRDNPSKMFIASRGCPYSCSFCHNATLQVMYKDKGKYVRLRSPEKVVKEIKEIKEKYGMKIVKFMDDTFTLNKKWVNEFLDLFKKEVGLPFFCRVRIGHSDEEIIAKLKEAGCHSVFFGLETGIDSLRKEVLNKDFTNEQVIALAKLLKKYKLKFLTYNMVGIPGETTEQALETVRLNARIRTDYPWCSIFSPYPGTKIAQLVIEKGLVDKDFNAESFSTSYHGATYLKQDNSNEMINIHDLFAYGVTFPFLIPVIARLIKLPPNKIFKALFSLSYFYNYVRSEKSGVFATIVLGFRSWKLFLGKRYKS